MCGSGIWVFARDSFMRERDSIIICSLVWERDRSIFRGACFGLCGRGISHTPRDLEITPNPAKYCGKNLEECADFFYRASGAEEDLWYTA